MHFQSLLFLIALTSYLFSTEAYVSKPGSFKSCKNPRTALNLVPEKKSGQKKFEFPFVPPMLKSRSSNDIEAATVVKPEAAATATPFSLFSGFSGAKSKQKVAEMELMNDVSKKIDQSMPEGERSSLFWRGCTVALCFVWSTQFAVVQQIFEAAPELDPAAYAAVRFSIAALALLPTYYKYLTDLDFVKDCFLIGFLVFIAFVGQSTGLKMGAASDKVAFIASLTVVWVPIQKAFQTGNFKDQKWNSVLLAIIGIAFLELESSTPPGLGDVFAFMQPVGFGSSIILLESVAKKRPPEMGAGVAGLRALGIAVPCLLWAAYNGVLNPDSIRPVLDSTFATSGILYLSLFTTAGMWYLQTYVTPKVSASDFSLILATEPIFATIIAIAWLGETVGSQELFGGLLVVIACIAADVSLVPKSGSSSSKGKGGR